MAQDCTGPVRSSRSPGKRFSANMAARHGRHVMSDGNKGPGYRDYPEHEIQITPYEGTVRVTLGVALVAESGQALALAESRYDPVLYLPRSDVRFDLLHRNDKKTYCPFKGDASYYDIRVGDRHVGSAVWAYEAPYDEVAVLGDYVAFYADRVTVEAMPG